VSSIEDAVERMRASAGADFAFVLTQRGRLVTRKAPQDMPLAGRDQIVAASRAIGPEAAVACVTMPRQDLVPYGGAAPVDVYVGVAAKQAIVAVVMATWGDKRDTIPATERGIAELEALIAAGAPRPAAPAPAREALPETKRSARGTGKKGGARPSRPPPPSGKKKGTSTPLGALDGLLRLSAAASRSVAGRPAPKSKRGKSGPEILVDVTSLGRDSLVEIHREAQHPTPQPDVPGVGIAFDEARVTRPWVESPVDAKRAHDAARFARKIAPPEVTLRIEEADSDVIEALLVDELEGEGGR
jgi:hypothetical protein